MSKKTANKKSKDRIKRMLLLQNPHCHYCNCDLTMESATLDHKLARAKGGRNGIFNLVLSCQGCNTQKADQDYRDFKK